jgi:hypothetical protein
MPGVLVMATMATLSAVSAPRRVVAPLGVLGVARFRGGERPTTVFAVVVAASSVWMRAMIFGLDALARVMVVLHRPGTVPSYRSWKRKTISPISMMSPS